MPPAHPTFLRYRPDLVPRARELRSAARQTPEERKLWYNWLRHSPHRFQRQKPIGPYIADFYCHPARLVVEVDGWHHFTEQGEAHDSRRTEYLQSLGLHVERLRGEAVRADVDLAGRWLLSLAGTRAREIASRSGKKGPADAPAE